MGYRTVVILENDFQSQWKNDPLLGEKIDLAYFNSQYRPNHLPQWLNSVECVHNDQNSLVAIDHSGAKTLAASNWYRGQENMELELLKRAAEKLGYRLHKIPAPALKEFTLGDPTDNYNENS